MDATRFVLPPLQRGIEGDLAEPEPATTAVKSPLPPFFKDGVSRWFNLTDYWLLTFVIVRLQHGRQKAGEALKIVHRHDKVC